MRKTIYLNIEDDIPTIAAKVARIDSGEIVLVFPKRSYVFADSINLRLLRKQTDLMGKTVLILTMDEAGQMYARQAGFELVSMNAGKVPKFSDISSQNRSQMMRSVPQPLPEVPSEPQLVRRPKPVVKKRVVKRLMPKAVAPATPYLLIKETKYPAPDPEHSVVSHRMPDQKRRSAWKIFGSFFLPVLLIMVVVIIFVLPQATIAIYPKTDSVIRDVEVTSATTITSPDTNALEIPAIAFNRSITVENVFQSTGKKEVGTKAAGQVRIINLTGNAINLKAKTTTLSLSSKNYEFTVDQNNIKAIPANKLQSGDYTPTIADVVATGGGEDYNVPAGTRLEITNQVFGSQPQVLYAKTESAIVGGTSRFISYISDADYTNAQNMLVEQAVKQLRDELAAQGQAIPDKGYLANVSSFTPDKQLGAETPSFKASVKVTLQGLSYNKDQLQSVVEARVIQSLPEGQRLVGSLSDDLSVKASVINVTQGTMTLAIHVEARSGKSVSIDAIPGQLVGKSKEQASDILLAHTEIDRVDITLSPYWQSTLPKFATKIKLEVIQ